MSKVFRIPGSDIKAIATGYGSCIGSDRITVDGMLVGFMYRDDPYDDVDSGWRFMAGDESDDYINNARNAEVYDVNTIANYDPDIIKYLSSPIGTAFRRLSTVSPLLPDHGE